jgi:heme-degrading monooxygenase HmoA
MSEFQDFLKRTFSYVAICEFKPGKFEDAQRLYEKAIATYGEGFKGSYLLRVPGSDRGIAVLFWESASDMESNHSEIHDAIMKQMTPLFAAPPTIEFCDLVCEIKPGKQLALQV